MNAPGDYCSCAICDCPIGWDERFVTIFRNLEYHGSDGLTNVVDSEVLVTICVSCGQRFPAKAIRVSFDSAPRQE
jgi:hypothetical protein